MGMTKDLYFLSKAGDNVKATAISAVFKKTPVYICNKEDIKIIKNDSICIITKDFDEAEHWQYELSKRNIYVIAFLNDAIENPIHIRNTVVLGIFNFKNLFLALKILNIELTKNKKRSPFYWGTSRKMLDLKKVCDKAIEAKVSIHITGEIGSGKSLLATYLAKESELISLNCSVLNQNLMQDTLFGHVKGAFTGAQDERKGLCRTADGKVLFLDELHYMPKNAQSMLLEVLETGYLRPLGADSSIKVHFTLITASSIPFNELKLHIREDLLSRIGIVKIEIPPLRERKDDIIPLIKRKECEIKKKIKIKSIDDYEPFINYSWPGNIRELFSKVECYHTMAKIPEELIPLSSMEGPEALMHLKWLPNIKTLRQLLDRYIDYHTEKKE